MRSFNPGEAVFLQGKFCEEFFGVVEGRFAKVRFDRTPTSGDISKLLSNATLIEIFDKPNQVFGEIDALLENPQPFSVYALDPSEAVSISVREDVLLEQMTHTPRYGVYACISFAKRLRQALDNFSGILQEEEIITKLISTTARAYLAVINELEQILGHQGRGDMLLDEARQHRSFELAQKIVTETGSGSSNSSVYSAVIRPPANPEKILKFPAGTMICKKGSPGDRLFILMEGVVEVQLGSNTNIQIARPGSMIGEIAVLLNLAMKTPEVKRTANVVCVTPVSAIVLGLDQVDEYLSKNPVVLTNLMAALTGRTKETILLEDGAKKRLHERLYGDLRHFLEGHHHIAQLLSLRQNAFSLQRPYIFAAQQARLIYNSFSHALEVLGIKP